MILEPIVTVMLSTMLYNVEVYGAPSCEVAKQYVVQALQDPNRSATGESWVNPRALICTYKPVTIDIRMTHLDGWHWNKQLVDNPFYIEE